RAVWLDLLATPDFEEAKASAGECRSEAALRPPECPNPLLHGDVPPLTLPLRAQEISADPGKHRASDCPRCGRDCESVSAYSLVQFDTLARRRRTPRNPYLRVPQPLSPVSEPS